MFYFATKNTLNLQVCMDFLTRNRPTWNVSSGKRWWQSILAKNQFLDVYTQTRQYVAISLPQTIVDLHGVFTLPGIAESLIEVMFFVCSLLLSLLCRNDIVDQLPGGCLMHSKSSCLPFFSGIVVAESLIVTSPRKSAGRRIWPKEASFPQGIGWHQAMHFLCQLHCKEPQCCWILLH